jgi:hypothetical protein
VLPLVLLAMLTIGLHTIVNRLSAFGLHRDELLYLAMGRHLRLWAMDFPPWIALLAEATRALLGDTDVALRLGPAFAHGALVVLAAVLARALRGGDGAQLLAASRWRPRRSSCAPGISSSRSCSTSSGGRWRCWRW